MLRTLLVVSALVLAACGDEGAPAPAAPTVEAGAPAPDTSTLAQQVRRDAAFDALAAEGTPDLDAFDLSIDRMERWALASSYLLHLTEVKPSLGVAWQEDGADPASYEAMLERLVEEPAAARQVERTGLSIREFVAIGVVYLRAAGAAQDPAGLLASQPGATPANIEFVRQRRSQIDALLLPLARPAPQS